MTGCSGFGLTTREGDVARLLMLGTPDKAIALVLVLQPQTVRVHVGRIMVKTKTANRTQAALRLTLNIC